MNLGKILEGAQSGPSVVRPVKFRVGAVNLKQLKTSAVAEAVLVYVGEDDRADAFVEASRYLAKRYPGAPIPPEVQSSEETLRFLAVALRDKDDPTKAFADPDLLRASVPLATVLDLMDAYRAFREAEYPVELSESDEKKIREQAAGK